MHFAYSAFAKDITDAAAASASWENNEDVSGSSSAAPPQEPKALKAPPAPAPAPAPAVHVLVPKRATRKSTESEAHPTTTQPQAKRARHAKED